VVGEPIPASDRTVTLGHNSPEQKQALENLDELVAAVEKSNDFPGDAEDKELIVAELSAGRRSRRQECGLWLFVRLYGLRSSGLPRKALEWRSAYWPVTYYSIFSI
jgi:hypothetical protein